MPHFLLTELPAPKVMGSSSHRQTRVCKARTCLALSTQPWHLGKKPASEEWGWYDCKSPPLSIMMGSETGLCLPQFDQVERTGIPCPGPHPIQETFLHPKGQLVAQPAGVWMRPDTAHRPQQEELWKQRSDRLCMVW